MSADVVTSKQQVYDYLDHPPQRYSQWCAASHGHQMMEKPDGAWVLFKDMDLYMLEGGQLMKQMADKHDEQSAEIERLNVRIAELERELSERS